MGLGLSGKTRHLPCQGERSLHSYLGAPQLDGPVEGGRGEEVGEVDGAGGRVAMDARDGPVVALEHLADARFAATHNGRHAFNMA